MNKKEEIKKILNKYNIQHFEDGNEIYFPRGRRSTTINLEKENIFFDFVGIRKKEMKMYIEILEILNGD